MATWATHTTPNYGTETINDCLALGSGKYVAVGTTGTVLTSADGGQTWTSRTAAAAGNWGGLATDGTTIVAVAYSGATRVMVSTDDGHTWTGHAAAEANSWNAVTYAAFLGMFIAVSLDGVHRVMTSTDSGATWAPRLASSLKGWSGVAASGSLVIAMEGSSGATMQSVNGTAWSAGTSNPVTFSQLLSQGSNAAAYSSTLGVFAFAGTGGGTAKACYTTDTSAWTYSTAAPLSSYYAEVGILPAAVLGGFLTSLPFDSAVSPTPTIIGETTDGGATWTAIDTALAGSWLWAPGAWDNAARRVVFFDNNSSHTVLVGQFSSASAVSPSTGTIAGNTLVTITGTGLSGVAQGDVLFGGSAALSVSPAADGLSLTCLTPAHAAGAVTVAIAGVGSLASAYTYVTVTKVSPNSGTTFGGTAVTITGAGFGLATGVLFDGVTATSIIYVSDTSITCVTPAHASGAVAVAVVGVDTLANGYTYAVPFDLLPPYPYNSPITQGSTGQQDIISGDWARWFNTVKTRIEALPGSVAAENIIGVLRASSIPQLPFSRLTMDSLRLIGRSSDGSGNSEEIALGPMLVMTGGVLSLAGLPSGYAIGDMLYASSATALARLSDVAAGSYLRSGGVLAAPLWSTLTLPNAATTGSVVFASATNTYGQDNAQFFWDDTNHRLGIGTAAPGALLSIVETGATASTLTGSPLQTTVNKAAFGGPTVVRFENNSTNAATAQALDVLCGSVSGSFLFGRFTAKSPAAADPTFAMGSGSAHDLVITASNAEVFRFKQGALFASFGGQTTSFPASKRESANWSFRLGDDSAYTGAIAAKFYAGGTNVWLTNSGTSKLQATYSSGSAAFDVGPVQVNCNDLLTNKGLYFTGTLTSSTPFALYMDVSLSAVSGSGAHAMYLTPSFTLAGNSDVSVLTIPAVTVTLAGHTSTNATSLKIENAPTNGTNKRSLWIAAGLSQFDGAVRTTVLGAFAAGDKYVIVDASGNLHVSALGPAS